MAGEQIREEKNPKTGDELNHKDIAEYKVRNTEQVFCERGIFVVDLDRVFPGDVLECGKSIQVFVWHVSEELISFPKVVLGMEPDGPKAFMVN